MSAITQHLLTNGNKDSEATNESMIEELPVAVVTMPSGYTGAHFRAS